MDTTFHNGAKALLVDDDMVQCELLSDFLGSYGWNVSVANTLEQAQAALEDADFEVVLLDVNLPDGSGMQFALKNLATLEMPIIFISGHAGVNERIAGLNLGADDFVNKPFDPNELLARMGASLRRNNRNEGSPTSSVALGACSVNFDNRIWVGSTGERLALTASEASFLKLLYENREKSVSREQAYQHLFNREWYIDDRTVDNIVLRLRKLLGEDRKIISTVRGVGYCLTLEKAKKMPRY